MKMHVYARFNEHNADGLSYIIFLQEEHEAHKRVYKDCPQDQICKYLCEIDIPRIDKSFVLEQGLKHIDKEIGGLQRQITRYQEKRQELLALDYKEEKPE